MKLTKSTTTVTIIVFTAALLGGCPDALWPFGYDRTWLFVRSMGAIMFLGILGLVIYGVYLKYRKGNK